MKIKDAVKLLIPYWSKMLLIMVLAVVIAGISAVTPFISQTMIDKGIMQGNVRWVVMMALLIMALQVGSYVIEYVQQLQEINISNDLSKKLKTQAFAHGLKLKPVYYKDKGFMQTMSDAVYYISCIMSIASNSFLTVLVVVFKCIGAVVGLFVLDWRLALFVLVIMPVKATVNLYMRRRAERLGKQLMDANKRFNAWYANIIQGVTDIKLYNLEKRFISEYAQHTENINAGTKRQSLMTQQNTTFSQALEIILSYGLYIIGAILIAGGDLTIGGLTAFSSFTMYVLLPVNVLFNMSIVLKQITPCVEGLKTFYKLKEENYDSALKLDAELRSIEFRDVGIAFDGRSILKNVNLKIEKGEKIAIVGENGSGKTTLMNLLLRFNEPTNGEILINGQPIEDYNIEDYRRRFSVVTQNVHLFKGTIEDNISFGNGNGIQSLEKRELGFCTEVIRKLEKEADVGADGTKLSGGERQKISLLRALEKPSQILVMDEPTSNYDSESCARFNEFIRGDERFDFYFIVTHDPAILDSVDRVITVADGKVTEQAHTTQTATLAWEPLEEQFN